MHLALYNKKILLSNVFATQVHLPAQLVQLDHSPPRQVGIPRKLRVVCVR